MGGLGTIGETAEISGRDMRGKVFPLSKYNAARGEIQWHYDNSYSNQHKTNMTRRMYFYHSQNSSTQIVLHPTTCFCSLSSATMTLKTSPSLRGLNAAASGATPSLAACCDQSNCAHNDSPHTPCMASMQQPPAQPLFSGMALHDQSSCIHNDIPPRPQ